MEIIFLIFAVICMLFQPSVFQVQQNRTCFCDFLAGSAKCNFQNISLPPHDNNQKKENVALGKPVKVSSSINAIDQHTADLQGCNAANGYTKPSRGIDCFTTGTRDTEAFWEVYLGKNYTVSEITVYMPLAYISFRLLTLSVTVDGITCYQFGLDVQFIIRHDIKCSTSIRGSRVQLQKSSKWNNFFTLCEVQVWVCSYPFYGEDCKHICNDGCKDCDNYDGSCWEGCSDGYYGTHCQSKCGYCKQNRCDRNTGICEAGICQSGWNGSMCNEVCDSNFYGENCEQDCNNCDIGCNRITGECNNNTCSIGWTGPRCDQACANNTWGLECNFKCGNCLSETACHPVTGDCSLGCAIGWNPPSCNTKCKDGTYGSGCSHACKHCKKRTTCDFKTGECPDGCEEGWTSLMCDKQCPKKLYGPSCKFACGHCKGDTPCDRISGTCSDDCDDGWVSVFCNQPCDIGRWGKNCNATCGACNLESCDSASGKCLEGCERGFQGEYCNEQAVIDAETLFKFADNPWKLIISFTIAGCSLIAFLGASYKLIERTKTPEKLSQRVTHKNLFAERVRAANVLIYADVIRRLSQAATAKKKSVINPEEYAESAMASDYVTEGDGGTETSYGAEIHVQKIEAENFEETSYGEEINVQKIEAENVEKTSDREEINVQKIEAENVEEASYGEEIIVQKIEAENVEETSYEEEINVQKIEAKNVEDKGENEDDEFNLEIDDEYYDEMEDVL